MFRLLVPGAAAASAAVGSMVMSIITVKILAIILLFIMSLSNIAIVYRFNFFTDTASSQGRSSASSSFRRPRPDGRSHGCSWPPARRDSASRTACCPAHVTMLSSRSLSLCGIRQSTRLIIVIASARVMRRRGGTCRPDSPKSSRTPPLSRSRFPPSDRKCRRSCRCSRPFWC